MTHEPVVVIDYDPRWAFRFEELAGTLRAALHGLAVRVEHIGSTAVEGLAAQPVIDVQVSVASMDPDGPFARPIMALGYWVHLAEPPEHHVFRDEPRTAQIHVCEAGGEWERRHLVFRDHLRANPDVAAEYAALKRLLAARFPDDRTAYTEGKAPFIQSILAALHH